jgi:hypothetical protein
MLSMAREGPNKRRGVAGRATLPSESACGRPFSRGLTLVGAFHCGFIKDGPDVSKTGLYPEGDTLR